jgi:hypothetical protein
VQAVQPRAVCPSDSVQSVKIVSTGGVCARGPNKPVPLLLPVVLQLTSHGTGSCRVLEGWTVRSSAVV